MRDIQRGSLRDCDVQEIATVTTKMASEPWHLDCTAELSAAWVGAEVRRAVRRKGVKFVVIDYLQLLRPENPRDNRVQQVGTLARRIKLIARAAGLPILLLAQLNREVENRDGGKPRLSDLRESGEIEAHADAVLLLHPQSTDENEPIWPVDVIIAKNRKGPTGTVTLRYVRPHTRFETMPV